MPERVKTSGLRDSYNDISEFNNVSFTCTEESKEPVGNWTVLRHFGDIQLRLFEVICGFGGEWIAPADNEWPLCVYKGGVIVIDSLDIVIFGFPESCRISLDQCHGSAPGRVLV